MKNRNQAIDQIRGLSIILMVIIHCARLIKQFPLERDIIADSLRLLIFTQPIVAAAFLFSSGCSFWISFNNSLDLNDWVRKKIISGIKLIGLGSLLFFLEYGLQWSHLLFSSNILSTIGFSFVITSLLIKYKSNLNYVFIGLMIISFVLYYLPNQTFLTQGPGPLFPSICIFIAGIIFEKSNKRDKNMIWGGVFIFGLILSTMSPDWVIRSLSEYDSSLNILNKTSSLTQSVSFWNHTPLGVIGCIFILICLYKLFTVSSFSLVFEKYSQAPLFNYLFHLMVVAIFYMGQVKISIHAYYGLVFFLLVVMYDLSKTKIISKIERSLK